MRASGNSAATLAAEIELHSKAVHRLQAILRGYRRRIDEGALERVAYFTTRPAVARLVERTALGILYGDQPQLATLDELIDRVRGRTRDARGGTQA